MKYITVTFKSLQDFKNRIARLWQDQEEDECYDFIFPDKETEQCFENLCRCFEKGNKLDHEEG